MMTRTEHLLACLAEECDEVGQRCMKALRFGLLEVQPGQALTNADRIMGECIDLLVVLEMLKEDGALAAFEEGPALNFLYRDKRAKVEKYMEHARSVGALMPESRP